MRGGWVVLLLACGCGGGGAPEPVRVVWGAAESPRLLEADFTVPVGTSLTIEPGVRVELGPDVSLLVEGELIARGTQEQPVVFTAQEPGPGGGRWGSVRFRDSAVDARFTAVDRYDGGSVLEHCVFERAQKALHLDAASPYVVSSTFRSNKNNSDFGPQGGAAIFLQHGAAPRIRSCEFTDNEATPLTYGGAIYAEKSHPILQNNVFRRNKGTYGGAVATDGMASPIVGNVFEDNSTITEGGAISLVSTVSALLGNRIAGNRAAKDGGGVHVCVDCFPHAMPFLLDNTITGNTSDAAAPTGGAAGVGAAYLRAFSRNSVHGNLRAGAPSDFGWFHKVSEGYPAWVSRPSLAGNFWGTTESGQVAAAIFDGADDATYGATTFEPVLAAAAGAPVPRATITTDNLRYVDGEPAMTVFVTMYNPGPARTVRLKLELQAGGGEKKPFQAPLQDLAGAGAAGVWQAQLPEDSVWFSSFSAPATQAQLGADHGWWHATLLEASGEPLGEPCTSRFDLARLP